MTQGAATSRTTGRARAGALPSAREIAEAWRRERPGTPTESIEVLTPLWRLAKLCSDDRARVLREIGVDAATLDLLSSLRRAGHPYTLGTAELAGRALVTAGAISQRVAKAEREGLVVRTAGTAAPRSVLVGLTPAGHALLERTVDAVLGRDAELVGSLTPEERGTLVALLEKLVEDVLRRV